MFFINHYAKTVLKKCMGQGLKHHGKAWGMCHAWIDEQPQLNYLPWKLFTLPPVSYNMITRSGTEWYHTLTLFLPFFLSEWMVGYFAVVCLKSNVCNTSQPTASTHAITVCDIQPNNVKGSTTTLVWVLAFSRQGQNLTMPMMWTYILGQTANPATYYN